MIGSIPSNDSNKGYNCCVPVRSSFLEDVGNVEWYDACLYAKILGAFEGIFVRDEYLLEALHLGLAYNNSLLASSFG